MNEEIIINGIDVSECPLFDKKTGCYHTFDGECVKDSCAVYKWLLGYKRLQEENEDLKTYIQKMDKPEIKTIDSEIALKNIELQKENDELKKRQITKNGFICDCEQNTKFKQELEEIRVIAKNACDSSVCHYNCKQCSDGKIIEKINEALNDRD